MFFIFKVNNFLEECIVSYFLDIFNERFKRVNKEPSKFFFMDEGREDIGREDEGGGEEGRNVMFR